MNAGTDALRAFVDAFKARELRATWIAQQLPLIAIVPIMVWVAHGRGRALAILAVTACGLGIYELTWLRYAPGRRHPPAIYLKVICVATVMGHVVIEPRIWVPVLVFVAMGTAMSIRASDHGSAGLYAVFVLATIMRVMELPAVPPFEPWLFLVLFLPYLLTVVVFDTARIGWEQRQLEDALEASGGTAWDSDDTGTILHLMGAPIPGVTSGSKVSELVHPEDERPDRPIPGSVLEYRVPSGNGWRWLRESVGIRATGSGSMRSGVRDITATRQANELTEMLARTDHLTGLPNRSAHVELLENWSAQGRHGHLLLIDFDGFKNINETLGHNVGDQTLATISRRFAKLPGIAHIARLGGDEFGAIVAGTPADAQNAAELVLKAGRGSMIVDDLLVSTGVSIGIAALEARADDSYRRASTALRSAKSTRGQAVRFDASLEERDARNLALAKRLPAALAAGEFVVFHQPKIELASGQLIGTEALVRWRHPDEGLIMPAEFLDLVKVGGHYGALTRSVLRAALRDLADLHRLHPGTTVAVNINSRNLREFGFADEVLALLDAANVDRRRLVLELTEDALVTGDGAVEQTLNDLDEAGIKLSVDDFGTGFSSLSYLARLPVSEIKLDRSLVAEVRSSSRDRVVVEAMLGMATNLGLQVIAEGIEDAATIDLLVALGCSSGQGYHIGRPMPLNDLMSDWARRERTGVERI